MQITKILPVRNQNIQMQNLNTKLNFQNGLYENNFSFSKNSSLALKSLTFGAKEKPLIMSAKEAQETFEILNKEPDDNSIKEIGTELSSSRNSINQYKQQLKSFSIKQTTQNPSISEFDDKSFHVKQLKYPTQPDTKRAVKIQYMTSNTQDGYSCIEINYGQDYRHRFYYDTNEFISDKKEIKPVKYAYLNNKQLQTEIEFL